MITIIGQTGYGYMETLTIFISKTVLKFKINLKNRK